MTYTDAPAPPEDITPDELRARVDQLAIDYQHGDPLNLTSRANDLNRIATRLMKHGATMLIKRDAAVACAWNTLVLANIAEDLGRPDDVKHYTRVAADIGAETAEPELIQWANDNVAWDHYLHGDPSAALALAETSVDISPTSHSSVQLRCLGALAAARKGDPATAKRLLKDAERVANDSHPVPALPRSYFQVGRMKVTYYQGRVLAELGETDAADQAIKTAWRAMAHSQDGGLALFPMRVTMMQLARAEMCVRGNNAEGAAQWFADAFGWARHNPTSVVVGADIVKRATDKWGVTNPWLQQMATTLQLAGRRYSAA